MLLHIATWLIAKGLTLLFGGDIMLNGINPSDGVFAGIAPISHKCDLFLGNLEIPLTNSTHRTTRKSALEILNRQQWVLKASPLHGPFLKKAGFGAVSLANNHAMDYGSTGLSQMIGALDKVGIKHAGAGKDVQQAMSGTPIPRKKRLVLLSVMGFQTSKALFKTTPATSDSPGIGALDLKGSFNERTREDLRSWIGSARNNAEIVIVAIHWGTERKAVPNPYQVTLGRTLVDCGADVVWGNHPHVLQGAEFYKGKLIMYSMGNLISNLPSRTGFIKLTIDTGGQQKVDFIPAEIHGGSVSIVKPANQVRWKREMQGLCKLLLKRFPCAVSVPAL